MRLTRLSFFVALLIAAVAAWQTAALASRAPSAAERRAILAGLPKDSILHQSCIRYLIRVSTVDSRYALVGYDLPTPLPANCKGFNGSSLMKRGSTSKWRQVVAGSEFDCDGVVPEPVMRDLVKFCQYGESSHFYSPSRNIECALRNHGSVLACVTFNNGISAYLYPGGRVQVRPAPAASFFQRAGKNSIIVPYGSFWNCSGSGCSGAKPFECASLKTGMKCDLLALNGASHGFLIAREGIRTF